MKRTRMRKAERTKIQTRVVISNLIARTDGAQKKKEIGTPVDKMGKAQRRTAITNPIARMEMKTTMTARPEDQARTSR